MKNQRFLRAVLLSALMLLFVRNASAQYSFASQITQGEWGRLTSDAQDNIILAGGSIAKMDVNNNWLWTKQITGTGNSGRGITDITSDAAGNIYITGHFWGTVNLDNITLTSAQSSTASSWDLFVAKMSPSGSFLWAKKEGTKNGSDAGAAVALDASGNVYVTGHATRKAFNGGSYKEITDIYVVKYNNTGTKQWEKKYSNGASNAGALTNQGGDLRGYDVATDASGNVFLTGMFNGTVSFGNGTGLSVSAATPSAFTAKLNGSGATQWVKAAISNSWDKGTAVLVDANGNVYSGGNYEGASVSFGTASLSGTNNFLAKYSTSGSLLWAVNLWGNNLPGASSLAQIKSFQYPGGTIGVAKWEYGIMEISPANGSVISSESFAGWGTTGYAGINDIAATSSGFVFSGDGIGTVGFGNLTISTNCPDPENIFSCDNDNFIVRYAPLSQRPALTAPENISTREKLLAYPNPVKDVLYLSSKNENNIGSIYIFDQTGKKMLEQDGSSKNAKIDISTLPAGIYILKAESQNGAIRLVKE